MKLRSYDETGEQITCQALTKKHTRCKSEHGYWDVAGIWLCDTHRQALALDGEILIRETPLMPRQKLINTQEGYRFREVEDAA